MERVMKADKGLTIKEAMQLGLHPEQWTCPDYKVPRIDVSVVPESTEAVRYKFLGLYRQLFPNHENQLGKGY